MFNTIYFILCVILILEIWSMLSIPIEVLQNIYEQNKIENKGYLKHIPFYHIYLLIKLKIKR